MKKLLDSLMKEELPMGAGVIAGHMLTAKLAPMIPYVKDQDKFHPLISVAGGMVLKRFGGKSPLIKALGSGMVAYGIAALPGKFVPALSINGISDEEINGVLNDVINASTEDIMQQYGAMALSDDVMNDSYDNDGVNDDNDGVNDDNDDD